MKRIILSTLLSAIIASASFAQDMTPEQLKALENKAKELYPSSEPHQNSWVSRQKNAFESIKFANYNLSESEMESLKKAAQERFPNDYLEQEEHIRSQADNLINLNFFSKGIDPEEFNAIKAIVSEESNGNADEYVSLIQIHLDAKKRIKELRPPEGVDLLDFKILQRIADKYYPYNYKKQLEEVQNKTTFLASISAAQNAADKKDPNAFNTVGLELLKKHTLKTSDADAKLAIAVRFKEKLGFFCPLSSYREDFELLTPLGDNVDIEKIHVSKTAPIIFVEVLRFPTAIEAIEIGTLDEVKSQLAKPLTLAGYYSTTKPSTYKISINAIRDDFYVLSNKTPFSFTDGTMLLDFENAKLLSFALREGAKLKTAPDFADKSKAMLALRPTTTTRANLDCTYPIIEKLENFEILDPKRMAAQMDYLQQLRSDNAEAVRLYTANSLSSLSDSKKYGKVARDNLSLFKDRMGEKAFEREARNLMGKLLAQMKMGYDANVNPNNFYVNIRNEIIYQLQLRKNLIEFYENEMLNNIEALYPRDILSAKSEPQQQSGTGKLGKKSKNSNSSRSNSNSLIANPL